MRDLGLDFQPRRPGLLALALFAAGLLLAADAWHEAAALREQLTDAELRLAQQVDPECHRRHPARLGRALPRHRPSRRQGCRAARRAPGQRRQGGADQR
jgi:hypothetical protein